MKKSKGYISVFFLLLCFSSLQAQNFWENISFPDTAANITCMSFNDEDVIYVGTGEWNTLGGLYKSAPPYDCWQLLFDSNVSGVCAVEVYSNFVFFGKKGINTFQISTDHGISWEPKDLPSNSDSRVTDIFYDDAGTLYVGTGDAVTHYPLLLRSYDLGNNWESLCFVDSASSSDVQDIMVSSEGDIYFCVDGYFEGLGGVYRSVDNGITWDFIGLENHMVRSLDVNSEGDILAGSWGGTGYDVMGIFILREGETVWENLVYGQIESCLFNSRDHIYSTYHTTFGGSVIRSLDNGISFEPIGEGLPEVPPMIIKEDTYGYVWIATPDSIFKSLESTAVGIDDFENNEYETSKSLRISPNPATSLTTFHYTLKTEGSIRIEIFNAEGTMVETINEGHLNIGNHETRFNAATLTAGLYYCLLVADGEVMGTRKMVVMKL